MGLWDEILTPRPSTKWAWVWTGEGYDRIAYADSFDAARHVAAGLQAHGTQRGEIVPAIITNSVTSIQGILGVWWAGATIASLPIIARGQGLDDYVGQLRRQCASVGARCLLMEERFAAILRDRVGSEPRIISYETLGEHPDRAEIDPPSEDGVIFVQFSSGTTAAPRGVELTGRAVDAQLRRLCDRLQIDPDRDVGMEWLPLSHDMGFFGGDLLAWYSGMRGVLTTPERFLSQPWTWFEDCARFSATLTTGPSFAYRVAGRAARPLPGPLSLRVCLVGGEQVISSHLRACADAFASAGLSLNAFTPAYGLAEATLAVAIGDLASAPSSIWVWGDGLFDGELAMCEPDDPSARELVSCGSCLPGFTVSHEGEVGELHVSGPSLAEGYHDLPEATRQRFRDGAFATGDFGFVDEGDLYVAGRLDDRLIAAGRNIDVAELELEISERTMVRSGSCAVVDVRHGDVQKVVLVAELEADSGPGELLAQARDIAARRHGLRIDRAVILDRGQFPKTPTGKAQRYRCRELALTSRAREATQTASGGG